MTKLGKGQIRILSEMAARADGGCLPCVSVTVASLIKAFPEYDWVGLSVKYDQWDQHGRILYPDGFEEDPELPNVEQVKELSRRVSAILDDWE